ncbi:MAG: hypothetical protein ACOX5R_02240 [bacterium]
MTVLPWFLCSCVDECTFGTRHSEDTVVHVLKEQVRQGVADEETE